MIDYKLLADAIQFYEKLGYIMVDVPWYIPKDEMLYAPKVNSFVLSKGQFKGNKMSLLGSAEQAFIMLMQEGKLMPYTKYMAVTPCFRDDKVDSLHKPYFTKLELFAYANPVYYNLSQIDYSNKFIMDAFSFFETIVSIEKLSIIKIADHIEVEKHSMSIELNGIEIGSYANRDYNNYYNYGCGTGLALPRFTIANEVR